MKRSCFISFKSFIFAISLLSFHPQLLAMESQTDFTSEQKQIIKNQYIAQCCNTCERYMKIEFIEMQFLKDVLSRIHEDINGLELQELYVQNDRCLSSGDKSSILKIIKSKIVKKYRYCDILWDAHERHQMNLLTFDELSQLQEFVRERDSYKHEPDVNQQIFAQLNPLHHARSFLEYCILEELHKVAQDDYMWLQHMAPTGLRRNEKRRSDVWLYIQRPKQIILGKIFSAAIDGCPVAQAFVRHYHFDFVLSYEPILLSPERTPILPLNLLSAHEVSHPAPSPSYSAKPPLMKVQRELNPDAPSFLPTVMPRLVSLNLAPKQTVAVQQDIPAQQDLPQPGTVDTQSSNLCGKHPAVKKQEPEKPVAAPEVLEPTVIAMQQTQVTQFNKRQVKKLQAKEHKRKKEKAPEKREAETQALTRQEPVEMFESKNEEVKPEVQSSLQPVPQQKVHKQSSQIDNNVFITRCYRYGKHEEALAFIEKLGNKHLLSWYRGVCLLQSQAWGDIKNAIDLLEPLFPLIPGRKCLDKRELVGFDDVVRALHQKLDNKFVKAFLIRLLLSVGNCPQKALMQNFIRESSSLADPSIQVLIFYIYDKGLISQSESSIQFVCHLISALDNSSLRQNIREEVIYFLHKIGQTLFDVNFQAKLHDQASYPHDDINTRCAISACYALVPALLSSDPLEAACMFIAAENTVAFLCKILQAEGRDGAAEALAYLPAGAIALDALQKFISQQRNIDVLSALIFSYSRRYLSVICHSDLSVDLAEISRQFLADAKQYFSSADHTNQHRLLLLSIASNAYSMLGCKLGIKRDILIELMRGVVAVSPQQYWFFRYNLESLIAGSQDEHVAALNSYRSRIASARKDALLSSMIISGLKHESSWWCTIL